MNNRIVLIIGGLVALLLCLLVVGIGAYFTVFSVSSSQTSSEPASPPPAPAATEEAGEAQAEAPADALPGVVERGQSGFETALPIEPGLHGGDLEPEQAQWYRFDAPNGSVLEVWLNVEEQANAMNIRLYDPAQKRIWAEENVDPLTDVSTQQIMNNSSGGVYYVEITPFSNLGQGGFILELIIRGQNDAGLGGDAGDEPATAANLTPGDAPAAGLVGDFDRADLYQFTPAAGQTVIVSAGEQADPLSVLLLDAAEARLWSVQVEPGTSESFAIDAAEGAPYYLRVAPFSSLGRGEYTVQVQP